MSRVLFKTRAFTFHVLICSLPLKSIQELSFHSTRLPPLSVPLLPSPSSPATSRLLGVTRDASSQQLVACFCFCFCCGAGRGPRSGSDNKAVSPRPDRSVVGDRSRLIVLFQCRFCPVSFAYPLTFVPNSVFWVSLY